MTEERKKPEGEPHLRVVDRRWWAREDQVESKGSADDATPSLKPTYVEELERQVADQSAQLQNVLNEHRRSLDEFEQAKVRIRREVAREVERSRRTVLTELLEVIDNLDRAIAAARESAATGGSGALANVARGVELVREQFLAKLDAFGVKRMAVLGERFDTSRHEAVTTTPVTDRSQDGLVVAVLKEGYLMGDEVLRPATVVVGAAHGR